MLLFSQMYLFIRKVLLKREAGRFKEKSAHPPFFESPWKLQLHLVNLLAIWRQSANGAHSPVSGLLCSVVSNGAMNEFGICFQWPNEHFNPRMLLFSEGNGAMKAPRIWQRRNECSTMVATARWDQCEFTSLRKGKCHLSIRRDEFPLPRIGET